MDLNIKVKSYSNQQQTIYFDNRYSLFYCRKHLIKSFSLQLLLSYIYLMVVAVVVFFLQLYYQWHYRLIRYPGLILVLTIPSFL